MRYRTLMTLSAVILATTLFAPASLSKPFPTGRPGVDIDVATSPSMFPDSWTKAPINAKAVPLADEESDRSMGLVRKALANYPASLLQKELKKVYVCQSIQFYGLDYGGTNSTDTVYLTNQGPERGYTDAYIVGSFHHEFSSILLRNHYSSLDEKAWMKCNPADFQYGSGGTDALRSGRASTKFDPKLAEQGFLTQYSQASLEEDFNMTAEGLFSGQPAFWSIFDEHPRFRRKAKLVVSFYAILNGQFNEAYFRSLVPIAGG